MLTIYIFFVMANHYVGSICLILCLEFCFIIFSKNSIFSVSKSTLFFWLSNVDICKYISYITFIGYFIFFVHFYVLYFFKFWCIVFFCFFYLKYFWLPNVLICLFLDLDASPSLLHEIIYMPQLFFIMYQRISAPPTGITIPDRILEKFLPEKK